MKYFLLSEFFVTNTGIDNSIEEGKGKEVVDNINNLVDNILDPAREKFGKPITITSGYRNPRVNKAIGGAPTSQHRLGEAADIVCSDNRKLFELLKGFNFDQLIWEKGGKWIHISYTTRRKNRKQILFL